MHDSHRGPIGRHTALPWATKTSLRIGQYRFGTSFTSAGSVCSGDRVFTHPSRLEIRWTWVSTGTAAFPSPKTSTQLATLRPTPGSRTSSSSVRGTEPRAATARAVPMT